MRLWGSQQCKVRPCRTGKLHLVLEHVERTALEDIEASPGGLPEREVRPPGVSSTVVI